MLMMMGFGAMALFQGLQVYRMQKTLQNQSEQIKNSARRRNTINQTEPDEDSDQKEEEKAPPIRSRGFNALSAVDHPTKRSQTFSGAAAQAQPNNNKQSEEISALVINQVSKLIQNQSQNKIER